MKNTNKDIDGDSGLVFGLILFAILCLFAAAGTIEMGVIEGAKL